MKVLKQLIFLTSALTTITAMAYPVVTGIQKSYITKKILIQQVLSQMIKIKGGTYTMGTNNKKFYDFTGDNMKPHKVTLTGFYFSKYLIDGTQYLSFLKLSGQQNRIKQVNENTTTFNNRPAQDTWQHASEFCHWLSKKTGVPFNLPTEAQWEYVARDLGKNMPYPTQNGKLEVGNNYPNDKVFLVHWYGHIIDLALPVQSIPINAIGIHQMGGNVNEWMKDWYGSDYYWHSPVHNPQGPKSYPGTYAENVKEYNAPLKVTRGINSTTIELGMEYHHMKHDANSYARMFAPMNSTLVGFRCVINSDKPMAELKAIAAKHQR